MVKIIIRPNIIKEVFMKFLRGQIFGLLVLVGGILPLQGMMQQGTRLQRLQRIKLSGKPSTQQPIVVNIPTPQTGEPSGEDVGKKTTQYSPISEGQGKVFDSTAELAESEDTELGKRLRSWWRSLWYKPQTASQPVNVSSEEITTSPFAMGGQKRMYTESPQQGSFWEKVGQFFKPAVEVRSEEEKIKIKNIMRLKLQSLMPYYIKAREARMSFEKLSQDFLEEQYQDWVESGISWKEWSPNWAQKLEIFKDKKLRKEYNKQMAHKLADNFMSSHPRFKFGAMNRIDIEGEWEKKVERDSVFIEDQFQRWVKGGCSPDFFKMGGFSYREKSRSNWPSNRE